MYEQFAKFYDRLGWGEYSKGLWPDIRKYLGKINFKPRTMLDVACGTGVLAIFAAKDGIEVEGLDLSGEMLKEAYNKSHNEGMSIVFHQCDMSDFELNKRYDLITCTFDAINHLTEFKDWKSMFKSVAKHLNARGLFLFDMNTLKDIKENWDNIHIRKHPNGDFDISKSISFGDKACINFTAFVKLDNGLYEKYEESIMEASFPLQDIVNYLEDLGFDSIEVMDRNFNRADRPEDLSRAFISCRL